MSTRRTSSRPRTTRPCSPSATRSARGSTSSPTARRVARATRTASPRRWPGVDIDNPGTALDRSGHPNPVPRVVGPIERKHPVQVRDVQFLRANTSRPIKITVPGPFTMSQQAQNDAYASEGELALAYAAAVHDEIVDLFAAGADIVQIDEPYHAGATREGTRVRPGGARPRARGRRRHDGRPHLLRVRRDHPRAPVGLLVPAGDGGVLVRPDLDRDGPVGPRHVDPRDAARASGSSSA